MNPLTPVESELILVAEDCPVKEGTEPPDDKATKTIARITFEVLAEHPYKYTEQELRHEVHILRRHRHDLKLDQYSIKRSPLLKHYGWGIHRDAAGKLALVASESEKYQSLVSDPSVKKTPSYRNAR